jgi:DNA-binding SARP family transcriptional activator/tetratricopeptide (TPR) repeat protein
MTADLQVRVLGPVDVLVGGVPHEVSGRRRTAILAALALQAGKVLSIDWMTEIVWGEEAPGNPAVTLQSHVTHLRRVLGVPGMIVHREPGYRLEIAAPATDAQVAESLIAEGTAATDPAEAASRLTVAVALWRGRSLAGLDTLVWFGDQARRLEELLLQAEVALMNARLDMGQHLQLVPHLEELAGRHPLHEPLHGQWMLALYRSGRQADALAVFAQLRARLSEELGVDPSPSLRDLHAATLDQSRSLDLPAARVAAARQGVVPAQLPAGVPGFTGRLAELTALDGLLARSRADGDPGLAVISGAAGVGKSSLTVHWARRTAAFPDGQLYADLRGFDPDRQPMDAATVIRGFLHALGVTEKEMPPTADGQIGLYRTLLAGRRMLVVLDNARDSEQVRPLLPSAAGCCAVVTSRSQLIGLVATHHAHGLTLEPLSRADARELLSYRIGPARLSREHAAVSQILDRCAGLPLALVLAAARAAQQPRRPLATLALELGNTAPLDALGSGDPASDIRNVFSWSYQGLAPDDARLFRFLALHPGPAAAAPALASLVGEPLERLRSQLSALLHASLLIEVRPGHYALHDLLRLYAAELGLQHDPPADRREAGHRLVEHYAATATAAVRTLDADHPAEPLGLPADGVTVEQLPDPASAQAWFEDENSTLTAVVLASTSDASDQQAGRLARAMTTHLDRSGRWHDLMEIQLAVLPVLTRLADVSAQAGAHRDIGRALAQLGRYHDATGHLDRAMDLYAALSDPLGQGRVHHSLGWLHQARGDHRTALKHAERALTLFREAGDRLWQARELNATAWLYVRLQEPATALTRCRRALTVLRAMGDRHGEAGTLDTMASAHHALGADDRAVVGYEAALAIFEQLDDRYSQAAVRLHLGDSFTALGDRERAVRAWRTALSRLDSLDRAGTETLRLEIADRLGSFGDAPAPPS